ncbi:ATP-binding protein [Actinospica sp. MGRD01-02]|uniref:ATP-binding protein n=1 Tax=Actinospica acidithermotolerans TaxID=2828514 RepID=A0A941E868_9ACTN|nr:ATP-binding SpoIIE family protein phosphatase [Actinospica acidithermotolerans]MBR7825592.1 ATP-binding protein [Actinospica acidithermotolerans]
MDALTGTLPADPREGVWLRQEVSLAARARRTAAALGKRIGLEPERVAEIELAVTETAVNLNRHAADGAVLLRLADDGGRAAVELIAVDNGPGMADVAGARRDGYSSAGTLGIGLGVVERMADSFDVHSLMGRGTVLVARFRARGKHGPAPYPEPAVAGLTRPMSGEAVCGDGWALREIAAAAADGPAPEGQLPLLVLMCDGLGHGPLAARASEQAKIAFHGAGSAEPVRIVSELHRAMAGTRGGALAVARIAPDGEGVSFCGVGNISAFIVADGRRSSLLSSPGIVGHHLPRLRGFEAELPAGASLVLHSDGLSERWDQSALAGLFGRSSTVIAAQLLREAGVRRDDASVVVVKGGRRGVGP